MNNHQINRSTVQTQLKSLLCLGSSLRAKPEQSSCTALFLDCFAEPVQSDSEVLVTIAGFVIHSWSPSEMAPGEAVNVTSVLFSHKQAHGSLFVVYLYCKHPTSVYDYFTILPSKEGGGQRFGFLVFIRIFA